MRFGTTAPVLAILAGVSGQGWAEPAADDKKPDPTTTSAIESNPSVIAVPPPEVVEYGVGLRLRGVFVPQSILELFVTRAAGGASNLGYGVDLVRRKGNLELQLGFEFEHVTVGQGVWIEKNKQVPGDDPDYVLSPDSSGHSLGWFTIEFTFLNHTPINKTVAIRYGGGLGLGIVTGELDHYNIHCAAGATNANPEPGCVPPRFNGQGQYTDENGNIIGTETQFKYDLPPVFPVVNAIIGLQIRPIDKLTINIETGIRTLPFFGVSSTYFF
jgi:hypothetical protein